MWEIYESKNDDEEIYYCFEVFGGGSRPKAKATLSRIYDDSPTGYEERFTMSDRLEDVGDMYNLIKGTYELLRDSEIESYILDKIDEKRFG